MIDSESKAQQREPRDYTNESQPPQVGSTRNHGDLIPQKTAEIDTYDKEIKDDVVYEITELPSYNETRALLIGNLRPPFDNADFQAILSEEASKVDTEIERAWLNERRTHCIVIVSEIKGAVEIQKNLNGRYFPLTLDNTEPEEEYDDNGNLIKKLKLYVEFIPVKATSLWIDQENKGPRDAVWKVNYFSQPSKQEKDQFFLVATHTMLNYPNRTSGYKSSSTRPRRRRGGYLRRRDGGGSRNGGQQNYNSRPPRGYRNSHFDVQFFQSYGGYPDYRPISNVDPYYYPAEQQQSYTDSMSYRGGEDLPDYQNHYMSSRNGNQKEYGFARNGYDGRRSRGIVSRGSGEQPENGIDYRRERSPTRSRNREHGYGSRSPPNRSPEWAD